MEQLSLFELPAIDREYQKVHVKLPINLYNKTYAYVRSIKTNMSAFIRELVEKEMEKRDE